MVKTDTIKNCDFTPNSRQNKQKNDMDKTDMSKSAEQQSGEGNRAHIGYIAPRGTLLDVS